MNDWERASAELFRAAREELSPSAADRELVRARLSKLGIGAVVAAGVTTAVKGAVATGAESAGDALEAGAASKLEAGAALGKPSSLLLAKVMGVAAVGGILGGILATWRVGPHVTAAAPSATPAPAAPSVHASTPRVEATFHDETTGVPSLSVDQLPVVKRPPSAISKRPAEQRADEKSSPEMGGAVGEGVVEEAALVAEIDAALRAGDRVRASGLIAEHERRFPRGLLVDEREAARVLVRCASAPDPAAADEFLRAHPRSPLHARIVAACGTSAKPLTNPRP